MFPDCLRTNFAKEGLKFPLIKIRILPLDLWEEWKCINELLSKNQYSYKQIITLIPSIFTHFIPPSPAVSRKECRMFVLNLRVQ